MFAYYRERSTVYLVRAIKDFASNTSENVDKRSACMFIHSEYSPAFDTISREYIYNTIKIIGFQTIRIDMIKNLYEGAICKIYIKECRYTRV